MQTSCEYPKWATSRPDFAFVFIYTWQDLLQQNSSSDQAPYRHVHSSAWAILVGHSWIQQWQWNQKTPNKCTTLNCHNMASGFSNSNIIIEQILHHNPWQLLQALAKSSPCARLAQHFTSFLSLQWEMYDSSCTSRVQHSTITGLSLFWKVNSFSSWVFYIKSFP